MKYFCFLFVVGLSCLNISSSYDTYPVGAVTGQYVVSNPWNITRPIGLESGKFRESNGLFVTSIETNCIYFMSTFNQEPILVSGIPFQSQSSDGQLYYATYNEPTRIAFDMLYNRLYVAERGTGYIRVVNFDSNQVGTMTDMASKRVTFQHEQQSQIYAGLDIQLSNNYLFVSDSSHVYSISGSGNDLSNVQFNAVVRQYTAIDDYFEAHGYPTR